MKRHTDRVAAMLAIKMDFDAYHFFLRMVATMLVVYRKKQEFA